MKTPRILAILVLLSIVAIGPVSGTDKNPALSDRPINIFRAANPLPAQVRTFLTERDNINAKIWIFFTDKGIRTQADFEQAAASISLSEKVLKRRAKVDCDRVLFADLPVHGAYIDEIKGIGGKLRRISKWLNAASFEIEHSQLDRISRLPFVASIKPVAISRRPNYEPAVEAEPVVTAPQTWELDYGSSLAQLSQIYVPEVHEQGFDGEGVTLAIFDTGYRKSHEAFAQHYADGRVLDEYDFIFNDDETSNELEDAYNQWNHGTYIWSVSGGYLDGMIYGPAYKANFLLAKTEDVRSETVVEEDNWVAALEWADDRGADVVTSSLAYFDWYTYEDMDGATAITTLAANTAAGLGIVVCNAMANSGPSPGSLHAPADAFDMLACGSVDYAGVIAYSSSRGPTYDGRTKPEVCARGVGTYCASTASDYSYGTASGTSLSTPLVAGAACLMIQAHPTYPPEMIRLALMETACNAAAPDNDYGWGIIKTDQAVNNWGATFDADVRIAETPLETRFEHTSTVDVNTYRWDFGDGETSHAPNPAHTYDVPGAYDVSLAVETPFGTFNNPQPAFIMATADTLYFGEAAGYVGMQISIPVGLTNTQTLTRIEIPFTFDGDLAVTFNDIILADRTAHFEDVEIRLYDPWNNRFVYRLIADDGGGSPPLEPGSGEVAHILCTINAGQADGLTGTLEIMDDTSVVILSTERVAYESKVVSGGFESMAMIRGDADASGRIDVDDALFLVNYVINEGAAPPVVELADLNDDDSVDIDDIIYLVEYMFRSGPPPPEI